MRLLVAGASGFIGKNLILKAPSEWDITGLYCTKADFPDFLIDRKITNVRSVRCDLSDNEAVRRAFEEAGHEFDAAVFVVGNSDIGLSIRDPKLDINSNITTLINLLSNIKVGRFIFMSSGTVYLGYPGEVSPKLTTNPDVPYGITKLASELYIKYFCARRGTIDDYVILRFFGAYGPMEPARKIYTNLIEDIYFKGKAEYTIRGDGKNLIDAMYIEDTAECILNILRDKKERRMVLDFCKGEPVTITELVERVAGILKKKVQVKHTGESSEYITFYASNKAMADEFGFRPRISLEEGIIRFRDYMEKNRVSIRS